MHINYSCTFSTGRFSRSEEYAIAPREILKIWCSLVRFGVYFDQIVS